jgi:hypothetical protein
MDNSEQSEIKTSQWACHIATCVLPENQYFGFTSFTELLFLMAVDTGDNIKKNKDGVIKGP